MKAQIAPVPPQAFGQPVQSSLDVLDGAKILVQHRLCRTRVAPPEETVHVPVEQPVPLSRDPKSPRPALRQIA